MAISVISMYKVIEYFTKLPYFYSYYNITTFFSSKSDYRFKYKNFNKFQLP